MSDESVVPMQGPSYWAIDERRNKNKQPGTIKNELRCLMSLFLWARLRGINIENRIVTGQFFSATELTDLANLCGWTLTDVLSDLAKTPRKVARSRSAKDVRPSIPEKRTRLFTIHSYLAHVSKDYLSRLTSWRERYALYRDQRTECLQQLSEHIVKPPNRRGDESHGRQGIDESAIATLLKIADPDDPGNPFSPQVRVRNFLIIRMLLELGFRRGELLSLYTDDFSLGTEGDVHLQRRPDNRVDTRNEQPSVKTAERSLDLSPRLAELVHEWCVYHRPNYEKSNTHPFLIVSIPSGEPMSLSAVNKMFAAMRDRVPALPKKLHPHLLRHTWNDMFSDMADENKIDPIVEAKWRAKLMGWRSIATAEHYTKRVVRRQANAALRKLHQNLDIKARGAK